jgi:tetratricopeptide (TPR) repeat protein
VEEARRTALVLQDSAEAGDATASVSLARGLMAAFERTHEPRLALAQALYRSGKQEDAIVLLERTLLEQTLLYDLEEWPYRALLGEIYRATGDARRAEALQGRPQEKIPDTAEAWYLRSLATLDASEALRSATEAVKRDPTDPLAWTRLTRLRMRAGDFEGAIQGADRLLELGEPAVIWSALKGYALAFQDRFEEGIEQFTRAIAAEPDAMGLLRSRAHLRRKVGDYPGAIADYTRVLEAAEEHWPVVWDHYQRATPLWIVGRTEEALQDYRRVRLLLGRPHFSDARACLILRYEGRQAEAQQILDAALRDVADSWLRQVLRCLDGRITPQELVDDATERKNPEQICEASYYAGEMCLLSGRVDEARALFEQCVQTGVEFDPDEFELAQWRLRTLFADASAGETEEN